jgi:hypothetical protein
VVSGDIDILDVVERAAKRITLLFISGLSPKMTTELKKEEEYR